MIRCRVIDFETTGFPPDAGVVEVGYTDIIIENGVVNVLPWKSHLTNPGRPIEIAAMAVHHITEEDIKDAPHPNQVLSQLVNDVDYFVAHNAKFEQEFFSPEEIPWICTLKAVYRLCPKSPNHQNQTIRYFLKTPVDLHLAEPAHRAGPDSYVTAHTLAKLLTAAPQKNYKLMLDTLVKWTTEPSHLPYCPIGDWRGRPWSEVEHGFLIWMAGPKTPKMEKDFKLAADRELKRRAGTPF